MLFYHSAAVFVFAFFASALCNINIVLAEPTALTKDTPANRPTRPQMPASFDRETVVQLLADIDKPYNASILKVGYFLRRGQPALPVDEGFALLQDAAKAEPVGTKCWFLLQNLRAFAAFRVPSADTSQGLEAYQTIFDHAADAAPAKAGYSLRQSILEFVDSVPGKFNDFGLSKDPKIKELLLGAWTAYATALSAPDDGSKIAEPDWNAALKKLESLDAFVPAVERVLADARVPKTFGLLVTAAAVLAPQKPTQAMELLGQAKPLIPRQNGKTDINGGRAALPSVGGFARGKRPFARRHPSATRVHSAQRARTGALGAAAAQERRPRRDRADVERVARPQSRPTRNRRGVVGALQVGPRSQNARRARPGASRRATPSLSRGARRATETPNSRPAVRWACFISTRNSGTKPARC